MWTIVNRSGKNLTGVQMLVKQLESSAGGSGSGDAAAYFDCYAGTKLEPDDGKLSFPLEAGGFGCVLRLKQAAQQPASLKAYLSEMSEMTQRTPLAALDATWRVLEQTMVDIPPAAGKRSAGGSPPPPGMVLVPHVSDFKFHAAGVEIEGKDSLGDGVQYPWEPAPQRVHSKTMALGPFFIDKFPVTCGNYSAFLRATGYRPAEAWNCASNALPRHNPTLHITQWRHVALPC
jgi:formylglycine-generating enzyme required for sulfatase activity